MRNCIIFQIMTMLSGDIVHFRTFFEHFILVSSHEAAADLFEKRSYIYASRPFSMMLELYVIILCEDSRVSDAYIRMGWNFAIAFKPYGDQWRKEQRMFQQEYKRNVISSYHGIQTKQINRMLHCMLTNPSDFRDHVRE